MTGEQDLVLQTISDLLQEHNKLGIEITAETNLSDDLEMDSVAAMDLIMNLEERFDIDIPLNLVSDLHKVSDLAGVVRGQMKST